MAKTFFDKWIAVCFSSLLIVVRTLTYAEGYYYVYNIYISGNRVTHEKVILQELNIRPNDSLPKSEIKSYLQKARNRIYNLDLFNEVKVSYQKCTADTNFIIIDVIVTERWYIWPVPVFELRDRNLNIWWQHKSFKRVTYGITGGVENFRGRNETVGISLTNGYAKAAIFFYDIPNLSYKHRIGLNLLASYSERKEVVFSTKEGREQFFRQKVYASRFYRGIRIDASKRITLLRKVDAYVHYRNFSVSDSVLMLNPDYLMGKSHIHYLKMGVKYTDNHVDIVEYPLKGYYYTIEGTDIGIGSKQFHSVKLKLNYQFYGKLWGKRHYWKYEGLAAGITGKRLPFEEYIFMGYDHVIRGNEYYVQQGHAQVLQSIEYRYVLVQRRTYLMSWMPIRQFRDLPFAMYLTTFYDVGYTHARVSLNNPLNNRWLYGYGIGINFLAPYGTVIKIDRSWNQYREKGWFVAVKITFR
ncbi:MAG: hypothetical protein NZ519_11610 [Bacteroidia bacterium]|nr:hypothetical protein [Bacteroidia bacterium]MDW8303078.1 POTRA domain-containing protein [Bacteroidia bacterium]